MTQREDKKLESKNELYENLSTERKKLQEQGEVPEWLTTMGWQLLKNNKYLYKTNSLKKTFKRVAATAASHLTHNAEYFENRFFEILWKGHFALSTPAYNLGTPKGFPVSCTGNYVDDSVHGFYESLQEVADLTKEHFGTSGYVGGIRPRGSAISGGGTSSGVMPVIKMHVQAMRDITQGTCFVKDTVEVLSESGFVTFTDAKEHGLKLASVGINGKVTFDYPLDFINEKYSGELVGFKDSKNIDIKVTDNHNMAFVTKSKGTSVNELPINIKLKQAKDDISKSNSYFLHGGFVENVGSDITPEQKLKIAFQADGTKRFGSSGNYVAIEFHFKKQRKIDRIKNILDELSIEYNERLGEDGSTYIYAKHTIDDKTLSWIDLSNIDYTNGVSILREISYWDGSGLVERDGKISFTYSSIDEINVNIIQSLCSIVGFKSRLSIRKEHDNKKKLFILNISQGHYFGIEKCEKYSEVVEDIMVECATTKDSTLIVRSNGHTMTIGNSRRGSWGGYIDLMHGDFDELLDEVMAETDDYNIGINYYDDDLVRLSNNHPETVRRYQRHMKLRAISGKGYFYFPDRVARMQPPMYEKFGLRSVGSNLCNEITLHADSEHSFTCVLSSMNLAYYDEWKDSDAVQVATVFLDCVVSETLRLIDSKPEKERNVFEKIRKGTEKSRALGLGVMGFHTYLQEKMVSFESMEAIQINDEIFTRIHDESLKASKYLATQYGEPEWCKGFGVRNTHRTCIPPTMSSSQICGTVSQGIEPVMANTYQQKLAGGTVTRINPKLMEIMKSRGVLTQENIDSIGKEYKGSVQHVDWLTEKEKQVFKTAYEINQYVLIDMASDRQLKVCQSQSLNTFCHAGMSEVEISELHLYAMFNPKTKGLYYMRSEPTSKGSSGKSTITECVSCSA